MSTQIQRQRVPEERRSVTSRPHQRHITVTGMDNTGTATGMDTATGTGLGTGTATGMGMGMGTITGLVGRHG